MTYSLVFQPGCTLCSNIHIKIDLTYFFKDSFIKIIVFTKNVILPVPFSLHPLIALPDKIKKYFCLAKPLP